MFYLPELMLWREVGEHIQNIFLVDTKQMYLKTRSAVHDIVLLW